MKITLEKLKKLRACKEGIEWFQAQKETLLDRVCNALLKDNHADWADWLIVRCMTKKQQVQYAVFAAEQVIHIFEKKYPEDKRPRKAIEAAKTWLLKPSSSAADAAADAADAAAAAAAAAYAAAAYAAAAYAAASSAAAAAAADAYAAAAADAADAYAYAAAADANAADARKDVQIKIINYGLKLLEEEK